MQDFVHQQYQGYGTGSFLYVLFTSLEIGAWGFDRLSGPKTFAPHKVLDTSCQPHPPQTPNPKPQTQTLNPKPQTLNPKP